MKHIKYCNSLWKRTKRQTPHEDPFSSGQTDRHHMKTHSLADKPTDTTW